MFTDQNSNTLPIKEKINITLVINYSIINTKMTRYSVQQIDQIFVKGYKFLSFTKKLGRNIGRNISKNLIGKFSQKHLNHAKQSATDALKTDSKRVIQKTAEATGDFIGNKVAGRMTKVSTTLPKNNPKTNEEEIFRETFIPSQLRHEIIDDLRLKEENHWWFKINMIT